MGFGMRHKLALTIALASFGAVTVLGGGMAGADPPPVETTPQTTGPTTTVPAVPSVQAPACSNGVDDDGDGLVDMADPGCTSPSDTSEATEPAPTAGSPVSEPAPEAASGTSGGGVHAG